MSREMRRAYKRHVEDTQAQLRRLEVIDTTVFAWVQSIIPSNEAVLSANTTASCISNITRQSEWQDFVISDEVARIATMAKDFGECMRDAQLEMWTTAVTAIALYETRKDKSERAIVPPEDRFVSDVSSACKDMLGKPFKQVFAEELIPCFDSETQEVVLTKDILGDLLRFLHNTMPNPVVADIYAEPKRIWEWAVVAYILKAQVQGTTIRKLRAQLNKKERAPRAPTKKQSDVIAELKAELKSEREKCKATQERLRSDMRAMAHEHSAQVAQLEQERDALKERLDYYTKVPEEVGLDELLVECEQELPQLPESGVVVVGGMGPLHARLLEKYPGWTCIPLNIDSFNVTPGKIVFQLIDSTTHKQSYRLEALLGRKGYYKVAGTGVDAILRCMRYRLLNSTKLS